MSIMVKTVSEQIYYAIRDDIFSQRRKPGEKLTTKSLQERLGVSSTPIREALTRLQEDGLIEYQPNVGMRVVRLTQKDIQDIFSLTIELDSIAMRFACQSPDRAEMIRQLSLVQEAAARFLADRDVAGWEKQSDQFHLTFYQYADNSRLSVAAGKNRMQFTIFSNAYQENEANRLDIQQEHDRILKYLEDGDDAAAQRSLRQHSASSLKRAMDIFKAQEK